MNAQISFIDGALSLIHIPLNLYTTFLQPILQLLLPSSQLPGSLEAKLEGLTVDNQHGFLNISVTPIECSIVCHSAWAEKVFAPAIKQLPKDQAKTVSISKETYAVFSVISAGMDAGSRVVDLTSPLALANIPIFFITTYYSDFILVPTKDRQSVVQTLLARGFVFSEDEAAFKSPVALAQNRGNHAGDKPTTPPPSNVLELQSRTFDLLKRKNVVPYIVDDLFLAQCSGSNNPSSYGNYSQRPSLVRTNTGSRQRSWLDSIDTKLYTSLVAALVAKPRFLSVTLAQDDEPSLLLDKALVPIFGDSLVGPTEGKLVPIFLDLGHLPLEATGIVSGVAGKLVQDMQMLESAELSYLSTARAGAVILSSEQSIRALDILKPLLVKE